MANIVEFVLKLKDLMSAGMRQAQVQAQHSMSGAEQSVNRVDRASARTANTLVNNMYRAVRGPRFLQHSVDELRNKLESVNRVRYGTVMASEFRRADREARRLERQIDRLNNGITARGFAGRMAGWRRDFVSQLPGGRFLTNPLTLAGGLLTGIGKIGQMGMQAEQSIAGLKTFVGDKAADIYKQIQMDASHTPFSVNAFKVGEQGLLSTGLEAKQARRDILNLANAIAAVGGNNEVFERMAVNMQQIKTQGHAMGIDVRQFAMASVNIYDMLAKSTGKSVPELKKMAITYDMLAKALDDAGKKGGIYYQGLYNQTQTLAGKIKIIKTQFLTMLQDVGQRLKPILSPVVDFVGNIVEWVMRMMPKYGNAITIAVVVIGGLAAALLAASAAQWALNIAMMANPIALIIEGIVAFIVLTYEAIKHVHNWGAGLLALMGPIGMVIQVIKQLYDNWESIKKAFATDGIIGGLRRLGQVLLDAVLEPIKQILTALSHIPGFGWTDNIIARINTFENKYKLASSAKTENESNKEGFIDKIFNKFKPQIPGQVSGITSGITSGGPRTITINVNKEMIGKLAINSYNVKEGVGEMENLIEEGLRRILYSAAAS